MDKFRFCAWVNGSKDVLDRKILNEEFSRFGKVVKIFVDPDSTFAKVYFANPRDLEIACEKLNGRRGLKVEFSEDDYKKKRTDTNGNSGPSRQQIPVNNFSTSLPIQPKLKSSPSKTKQLNGFDSFSNYSNDLDMDEMCSAFDNYVDLHGRQLEVVEAETGELFVNLDDVRRAGFGIFTKESFENAVIPREYNIREFENFLLNCATKYLIENKKNFSEEEVLGTIEKVRAKLQNKSTSVESRSVNTSSNSKGLTITATNLSSPQTQPATHQPGPFGDGSSNRPPKSLGENFAPSFSHIKPRGKNESGSSSDTQTNGYRGGNRNQQRDRNTPRSNHSEESGTDSRMRTPKTKDSGSRPFAKTSVMANFSANEEPQESWEGEKSSVQKSTRKNDVNSNEKSDRDDRPPPLEIERVKLAPNSTNKVKVCYVNPSKNTLFYAYLLENAEIVDDLLIKVNEAADDGNDLDNSSRGTLCLAQFEDIWYRAAILKASSDKVYVELIDYGNKENITVPLKEMPENLKKIPGQAIRISVHQTSGASRKITYAIDDVIEVFIKKCVKDEYDDETHLVEVRKICDSQELKEASAPASNAASNSTQSTQKQEPPKEVQEVPVVPMVEGEPCYLQVPPSSVSLKHDEPVMVLDFTDKKFILRNRENASLSKVMYDHIKNMDKQPIKNPKVGQVVLCSCEGYEGLHRATIKSLTSNMAEVESVDYSSVDTLPLKSLRNIDETLSAIQVLKIESPEFELLKNLKEKSIDFLQQLIRISKECKNQRPRVVLDGLKFDLLLTDDAGKTMLLSDKIKELESPAPVSKTEKVEALKLVQADKETAKPVAQDINNPSSPTAQTKQAPEDEPTPGPSHADDNYVPIMYDGMDFVDVKPGKGLYICYSCTGEYVTLISVDQVENTALLEIKDVQDNRPYGPTEFEVCLAKYQDAWYRGVVTESHDGGKRFTILFVDYGNEEIITREDVRRIPEVYVQIPVLGIAAYFMGIDDLHYKGEIQKRLRDLIPDETILEVDIKTELNEEAKYGIEIPLVYQQLREAKLIK